MGELSHELLLATLDYAPSHGIFRFLTKRDFGKIAGTLTDKGSLRIRVGDRSYYAHRLAVFYATGKMPTLMVDHINGDPSDNRIANLREATPWENAINAKDRIGAHGMAGVAKTKTGRFQAQINHRGKHYALGTFDTKEEAHEVYKRERIKLRGDLAFRRDPLRPKPDASTLPVMSKPPRRNLTIDLLKSLLHYDPATGIFTRLIANGRWKAGSSVSGAGSQGYLTVGVDGHQYLAHRVAWFYMTGAWPDQDIDHINRIRTDNRFHNLRQCSRKENARNRTVSAHKRYKGISFNKKGRHWSARITVDRKTFHLGTFETEQEAHLVYMSAARTHFGEFACGAGGL